METSFGAVLAKLIIYYDGFTQGNLFFNSDDIDNIIKKCLLNYFYRQ